MLIGRHGAAAVGLQNGSALVSGGYSASLITLQSSEILTGSTWTFAMQLPSPRYAHCMLQLSSGELFINGGYSDSGILSDTYISEDHSGWKQMISSKKPRQYHTCTEVTLNSDQQVWVGGSLDDSSSEFFQLGEETWTWTDGPDLPDFSMFPGRIGSQNGKLIYAGGYKNKNIYQLKDVWTQRDAWTKVSCCFTLLACSN
jgi:hypothetical protein